jgi:hypothetical protein
MIATLEVRVLISGSVFFSEKVDTSSSHDRLQVAVPAFRSVSSTLCAILGFLIQPSSVDRTSSRLSSASPFFAICVTWDKSYNREISEETEAGKILINFQISRVFDASSGGFSSSTLSKCHFTISLLFVLKPNFEFHAELIF